MSLSLIIAIFIYLLYGSLMFVLPPEVAYGFAYFGGIVFAFIANGKFVFNSQRFNIAKFTKYLLSYLLLLSLSVTIYHLVVYHEIAGIWWAPIVSGTCIYPLSYSVNALILTDRDPVSD